MTNKRVVKPEQVTNFVIKRLMSTIDKLKIRLLSRPKDFTYKELQMLLASFGYNEVQGMGARICFIKENHKIKLHKPHPKQILKRYQLDLIIDELTMKGLIKQDKGDE